MDNGNGTFVGGPFDVISIWHNVAAGTFHAVLYEEHPMPGPAPEVSETKMVRLKSKMHHTTGATTFADALDHLEDLAEKIKLPEENVWRGAIPWDGQIGGSTLMHNWRFHENGAPREREFLVGIGKDVHAFSTFSDAFQCLLKTIDDHPIITEDEKGTLFPISNIAKACKAVQLINSRTPEGRLSFGVPEPTQNGTFWYSF